MSRTRPSTEIHEQQPAQTTTLAPLSAYTPPSSLAEIIEQGPSKIGFSSVSQYLACPERARLQAEGVRVESFRPAGPVDLLDNALWFGSTFHALDATRVAWGMEGAEYLLDQIKPEINAASHRKLADMLRTINFTFPVASDEHEVIAVEQEVWTDIGSLDRKKPRMRSVRYDKIVRLKRGDLTGVYGRELKTSRNAGEHVVRQYTPNAAVHSAVWNSNKDLVQRYGVFRGEIFEVVTKTNVPAAYRYGPFNFVGPAETLVLKYMRLPEEVEFPVDSADGSYPKMIHSCWGKYGSPCPYMGLCWRGAQGHKGDT